MKYLSTRGKAPQVGFIDALLQGLAPDGGLYVPVAWPAFTHDQIAAFAGRPYAEVAAVIVGAFAGEDIAADVISQLCAEAYAGFAHAAVAPLKQLSPGTFLLELFHGPTLAFKDLAMQLLARLYDHALAVRGGAMTVVCATSGDTGGAAVKAFAGRANVRLVVLFPQDRISEVQRRFITACDAENVRAVAVAGDFDDCQAMVKAMFEDADFVAAMRLAAVNSINIARIVAQSVYYFTAAVAVGAPARRVAFSVPTGNFGDAFAGFAASRMGLPIERIVVATNGNDIVVRAIEEGRYAREAVIATQSPAMDIQVASNFERLYFESVERMAEETARAFRAFGASGMLHIPPAALERMRGLFTGAAVSEARTARTILATFNETGELIDPHTAVGVAGALEARITDQATPVICLATAHPAKFPQAVRSAAGVSAPTPPVVAALADATEHVDALEADVEVIKAYVRGFAQS
ncbi:MAG TPA: threonine synthase [Caulobacteraceae bacterium]